MELKEKKKSIWSQYLQKTQGGPGEKEILSKPTTRVCSEQYLDDLNLVLNIIFNVEDQSEDKTENFNFFCGKKHNIKFTILTIFKCTVQ